MSKNQPDPQLIWATQQAAIKLEELINFIQKSVAGCSTAEATIVAAVILGNLRQGLACQEDSSDGLGNAVATARAFLKDPETFK